MALQAGGRRAPLGCARADPVRVAEELAVDDPAGGLEDAGHLAPGGILVGDLPERRNEHDRVERCVGVGQVLRVGAGRRDVLETPVAGAAHRVVEHRLLDVEDVEPTVRPDPLRQRQRVVAGAGADLEDSLAWPRLEDLAQPRAA